MRGRPPKPTELHHLEGTFRLSRHRRRDREPRPALGVPSCPRGLSLGARREWRRIAPELAEMGLLSAQDRAGLAVYCADFAAWMGVLGQAQRFPLGSRERDALERLADRFRDGALKMANELGMTPLARSRFWPRDG
jgi:P27 family predicted phage terminase small subunit